MPQKTSIRRAYKNKFTVISNNLAQNNNLSLKARGLICYFLSLPDDWVIYVDQLSNVLKEKRCSILSALKELKKEGYIHHTKLGYKEGWQYFTFGEPVTEEEFKLFLRTNRFSNSSVNEQFENQQLQKNKNKEKEYIDNTNTIVTSDKKDVIFDRKLGSFENIDESLLKIWKDKYKQIDVEIELKKAIEWIVEHPTKNKKRKIGRKFLEETWFKNAEENNIYKAKQKIDSSKIDSSTYDKLNPLYLRYKKWYEDLRDPALKNIGFLTLEKECFYEYKNPSFKYKLDEKKYIDLLKSKFLVPDWLINKN